MLPEPGHLNPTFPIARALASRGHEVVYTSLLDLQPLIESRGFRCVPIHEDIVRLGRIAELKELTTDDARTIAWREIRQRTSEEYFDGTIEELVRALDPDVIAADIITQSPLQFVAHRLNIPCLQVSTSLSQRHDQLPPLSSDVSLLASALELEAARWASSWIHILTGAGASATTIVSTLLDDDCVRFGYPSELTSSGSVFAAILTAFPEVVLAPSALDFPRAGGVVPTYVGSPVDLERAETVPTALREFVEGELPLIYVSLGSQSERYPEGNRFFSSVIEMMREHPEWRAVVPVGRRALDHRVFADLPPNILVVESAPQLWLLGRASVFVTHAGLGSVCEAIALRVPLIAVPQQFDQPGNATRIAYHKIGLQIPPEVVSGSALTAAAEHILGNVSDYKARIADLDARCRREAAATDAVALFESLGATRAHTSTASRTVPHKPLDRQQHLDSASGWMLVSRATSTTFRSGAELCEARTDAPIGIGRAGFTISPSFVDALQRANGAFLVRADVLDDVIQKGRYLVGRKLRSRWVIDVSETLFQYAYWCVERVFEEERLVAPELVEMFGDLMQRSYALRHSPGVTTDRLIVLFVDAFNRAAPLWRAGYGAAAMALVPGAHVAAESSRSLAIRYLARRHVGVASGGSAVADAYVQKYELLSKQFAAELDRRIDECCRVAGLATDDVVS